MEKQLENVAEIAPVQVTDGAVGVRKSGPAMWFVAVVNNRSERKSAECLDRLGYETFVPIQTIEEENSKGKIKKKERIILPAMVIIHCTEEQRKELVNTPFIKRFRVDKTSINSLGGHPLLVIPDKQLKSFRLALSNADEEELIFEETPFVLGEEVMVRSGKLKGMTGNVIQLPNGQQQVVVALGQLGCYKLTIPASKLQKKKN